MSTHYGAIAFTGAVGDVQRDHGSHAFYDRKRIQGTAAPGTDALTEDEKHYLHQRRLKIYGHARIVTAEQDPTLVGSFADPAYGAVVERAVLVAVEAFDSNCPQHITARFTVDELDAHLALLRHQLAALRAENTQLRDEFDRRE
ncbi:hypothetical protein [Mycolicibacterium hodleri]|uniref:Pyridoxamine 5'-phosphate oxidase n=1 Tax=Mycolicibacterium hodleri TaxID=49897 RepID=A0A502E5R9_9MYCO|nr:hypothetical protein [Mycolicibacterium hodleri]TPG32837.1 hypothetical protein EAH80_18805 [Mycolicibacterium hodleri]